MTGRLDMAVAKGCDGVEPDNVDSYSTNNGFGLTASDQINFNKFIAQEAHNRGLSIGLKNDLDQVSSLVSFYDWALNEQCNEYDECDLLRPFVTANKAVFGTEYSGSASSFCPAMNSAKFSVLLKNLNLDARVTQCCSSASGGCQDAPYTCVDRSAKRAMYEEPVEEVAAVQSPDLLELHVVDSAASVAFTAIPVFVVAATLALVL
jgi:hypothetical protein